MKTVLLALSTFRKSERAVETALVEARRSGRLTVLHVVDKNLARYLLGMNLAAFPEAKERCEADILKDKEDEGRRLVAAIASRAADMGIDTKAKVVVGRFAQECLKAVEEDDPELVVTTRSQRPAWVKRLFGSPVDEVVRRAGRPVIEA